MSKIKIKNFGPIRDGFVNNNGWMDIEKVTVFIGDQGSGKSTVAKLISVFFWLEKSLYRRDIKVEQLNIPVFETLCKQQELGEYFLENTLLCYEGDVFDFEYDAKNNIFKGKARQTKDNQYILPKIQYISAARNLLTILYSISTQNIVDKEGNIIEKSPIPYMVRDLNKEYLRALAELAKNGFSLPLNETSVYYRNHSTFIKAKGKSISMSAASSGIQSITPLLLVSHFLSEEVTANILDKIQDIDDTRKKQIENNLAKEDASIIEKYRQLCNFGKGILAKEDAVLLTKKLKQYIPSSFINIVEEPEQNLFPTSQQKVINSLLEYNNTVKENKLIISTHSPYILTSLNNSIFAKEVFEKTGKEIEAYDQNRRVAYADVSAFKFEDGNIISIKDEETRLIAADAIDSCSAEINSNFDKLLDLLPENEE